MKPEEDVAGVAIKQIDAASAKNFDVLAADAASWWHDYWAKGFVYMHSPDGQADFVEGNYTYFLYIMGSSSRGCFHRGLAACFGTPTATCAAGVRSIGGPIPMRITAI